MYEYFTPFTFEGLAWFSGSVFDPDPDWIGLGFNGVPGSGSRRAKMTHNIRKKLIISFKKGLDVLFFRLKVFIVAWASFKEASGIK